MKIALYNLTTTTKAGGIETFNREMANTLAKRGHTVHLYGGKGPFMEGYHPKVSVLTYPFIKREYFPNLGSRFRKFMERLSFGLFAGKRLSRGKYDYIYISKPFDLPVALFAAFLSGARVIFGSGGTEFFPGYKKLVSRLDYFFACSGFNATQIEQYCGIRPQVLPNGVNTELFRPLPANQVLKQNLGIKEGERIIVSACRLVGWKGINYAIKAVDILKRKGHNARYCIIGDGEGRKELENLASSLDLKEHVLFLGNIPNVNLPEYYSIADLAVFPSVADETFGIAIAEAMACGVPIITTDVGGIPEVVGEKAGLLVPPRDEKALAKSMKLLLSEDQLRSELGAKGKERVTSRFSWDRIAEKFEQIVS